VCLDVRAEADAEVLSHIDEALAVAAHGCFVQDRTWCWKRAQWFVYEVRECDSGGREEGSHCGGAKKELLAVGAGAGKDVGSYSTPVT
jgi:hypothetical protein